MTYIDIILLAVIIFIVLKSVKNGFFKTLFDLVAYFLAFGAAKKASPLLAQNVFDSYIKEDARAYLEKSFSGMEADLELQAEHVYEAIPESLRGLLQILGFSEESIAEKVASSELESGNIIDNLMNNIIEPIGVMVAQFVIFVVLGIVLLVVAKIVVSLLNGIIKKLPLIKNCNAVLGGVLGFVKAVVITVVISGVLGVVASVSDNQSFISAVSDSFLVKSFTDIIGNFSF